MSDDEIKNYRTDAQLYTFDDLLKLKLLAQKRATARRLESQARAAARSEITQDEVQQRFNELADKIAGEFVEKSRPLVFDDDV
ncbi:hypothetical protein [Pseudomonas sp. dw_358]|uniref:hypothetical protein n=1 Tax=Pseudomonas sp. dw_358 TaxID=2720083 RepID=UPI001BD2ECDA|nr:hypothetical protein [Pseudomonas sp. dw_358]